MTKPCARDGCTVQHERKSPYCSLSCYQRVYFSKHPDKNKVYRENKHSRAASAAPVYRNASKEWAEVRARIVAAYGVKRNA